MVLGLHASTNAQQEDILTAGEDKRFLLYFRALRV